MTSETPKKSSRWLTRLLNRLSKQASSSNKPPPSEVDSPVQYPLGLDKQHLEALAALTSSPNWRSYSEALERLFEQQATALLSPLAHDAYLFQAGVIYAMQRIAALPTELVQKGRELDARRTEQRSRRVNDAALATLNTPFYAEWKRLRDAASNGGTRS